MKFQVFVLKSHAIVMDRNFWDACPWEEDLQYARQVRCTAPS